METALPLQALRGMLADLEIVERQLQEFVAKLEAIDARMKMRKDSMISSAFGEKRGDIERHPQSALADITRKTPIERRAVIALASDATHAGDGIIERLERLVQSDIDVEVRTSALYNMCKIIFGAHDRHAAEFFYDKLMCAGEHNRVRKAAYYCMLAICGENIIRIGPPSRFQFPADVDWALVERLRRTFLSPS